LSVSVPGLADHRVRVTVPPSRTLALPIIRLLPATYFRARFVGVEGEPIMAPRLHHRPVDADGFFASPSLDHRVTQQVESDGTVVIGPLPRGVTSLALDTPPLALTRLPNVLVTGTQAIVDGGTVIVEPGARLAVEVVDTTGAPVIEHDVFLEDALPFSPVGARRARTDASGRATFDRLGAGSYRLRTRALERCATQVVTIARLVAVSGRGSLRTRLIVDGAAAVRVTSPLGPLRAIVVSASADFTPSMPDPARRIGRPFGPLMFATSCSGATDGDGRVRLNHFPPGPAQVEVRLLNSTTVRRVNVPVEAREIPVAIPDGYLPVRVTDASRKDPVGGASITWTASGSRVEATSSANGEALLEGVGTAGGTLMIRARGYEPAEAKLPEPPGLLYEVALIPSGSTTLQARVVTASGAPLPDAVVALGSQNAIDVDQVAVTDANGFVRFSDLQAGTLRLAVHANSYVSTMTPVADNLRDYVVLTLSRGYRVTADVQLPAASGARLVRVLNEAGASMDAVLDAASDRVIAPPGLLSLGVLPPGHYVLLLDGLRGTERQHFRIADGDVHVSFR
jgi:hypothetical protein